VPKLRNGRQPLAHFAYISPHQRIFLPQSRSSSSSEIGTLQLVRPPKKEKKSIK